MRQAVALYQRGKQIEVRLGHGGIRGGIGAAERFMEAGVLDPGDADKGN